MNVTVNRESLEVKDPNPTVRALLAERGIPEKAIVVAVNGEVVRQSEWGIHRIEEGDEVEIVHAVAGGSGEGELVIAGERFSSRLFLGTGKYPDAETMNAALERSGTEMVTVAIRYMDLFG
ncbi:MAG: sulfur carrier protein ThiS, partial [Actinobacteria bacterium]|nr:sulfur carrier protein ThiS [Actinomycetota bacterium]